MVRWSRRSKTVVGGMLAAGWVGGALCLPSSAQTAGPTLSPTSGPIGTVVAVSGPAPCDFTPVGGDVQIRFFNNDGVFQRSTSLGTTTIQPGRTISMTVTIPSTVSELRPGDGIFTVPVTAEVWEIAPNCSSGGASLPSSPFTVTAGSATTSTTRASSTTTSTTSTTVSSTTSSTSSTTSLTATTLPSATATTSAATASVAQAQPGQVVQFSGNGFAPNSAVQVLFLSDPVSLGSAKADKDGAVVVNVTIPARAEVGSHRIVARGVNVAGGVHESFVALTVVKAAGSTAPRGALARTGSASGAWSALAGLFILVGVAALGGSRRLPRAR